MKRKSQYCAVRASWEKGQCLWGTEEEGRDPDKGMSGKVPLDREALELGPEP